MTENPEFTSREAVLRVLYHVVKSYEQANRSAYGSRVNGVVQPTKMPRRFVLFGRRLPCLGGDSELLRDAVRIAKLSLKDNDWWDENEGTLVRG